MKILIVCLGNICRSPMAEIVLKRIARERGLDWVVRSVGTNRYHKGGPADSRGIAACRRKGMDLSAHIATRIKPTDFDDYDLVMTMAPDVDEEMQEFLRGPKDQAKVVNFLEPLHPGKRRAVPDPWYEDDDAFDSCLELIEEACAAWVERLSPSRRGP